MPKRLAVLASGTGTLLEAMIVAGVPIELVVVDRNCRAYSVAVKAGIPAVKHLRTFGRSFDRWVYTDSMVSILQGHKIELVAMAGFMTVFGPTMFETQAYAGKVLNTHPSLLPAFPGDHAVRDALAYGVKVSGFTIHWATAELDSGPIVVQEPVYVEEGDTVETLHERIKAQERIAYSELLHELVSE